MTLLIKFEAGLKPVFKHEQHDQSTHGSWADGSQSASELSDDAIREIIYGSKTVEGAYASIAKKLGKSMKVKVAELSDDEINVYRGLPISERGVKALLEGKIRFSELHTWGQGIYISEEKSGASNYGTPLGMMLDKEANLVRGELKWGETPFSATWDNPRARTLGTAYSDSIDYNKIQMNGRAFSVSDVMNLYWAGKGFDGYRVDAYETVLFNGGRLTVNSKDIVSGVKKHQEHDQSTHGSWATGSAESSSNSMPYAWSPKIKAPSNTSTEFEKFEYEKGKTNLQEVAKSPTAIRLYTHELEGILEIGRFKTLEEQPRIDDEGYKQARQELEVGLWGVPEEDKGPIYGYIDTPLKPSLDNETRMYGELKLTLKDSVASRTTITAGDSANRGLTPVLLKDAKEGILTSQQVDGAYRSRAFQSGAKTVTSPQIIVGGHSNIDYYEAQIHGGISLKDIQSVFIPKGEPIKDSVISTLESKGIKVNRG